jgi:hypothetical protein
MPPETREQARQRIKQNIRRREESSGQVEKIEVDLFDELREGNQKFFNLFDFGKWEDLKTRYKDPTNSLSLAELVGNLMEGR